MKAAAMRRMPMQPRPPNVNALTVGVLVTPHLRRRIPTNAQILDANAFQLLSERNHTETTTFGHLWD